MKLSIQVIGLKNSFRASLLVPGVACNMLVTCFFSFCTTAVKLQLHDAEHSKELEKIFIIASLESVFFLIIIYLKTGYLGEGFLGHAFELVFTKMSCSATTEKCMWRHRRGDGI